MNGPSSCTQEDLEAATKEAACSASCPCSGPLTPSCCFPCVWPALVEGEALGNEGAGCRRCNEAW